MGRTKTTSVAGSVTDNGYNGKSESVVIPALVKGDMTITVKGLSALIMHRWSPEARAEMLAKQMKKAKTAKTAKDPQLDYAQSMYWISTWPGRVPTDSDIAKAIFGFPVLAFKSAAVDACTFLDGVTKVQARGSFFASGIKRVDGFDLVEIEGKPRMYESMVRVGMGTADIRYRGIFEEWSAKIRISYNANGLSPAQIVNLFNIGGFSIGVGEHRPQTNGDYGRFEVVDVSK